VTGWKTKTAVLIGITALSLSAALLATSPDHARAASLPSRLHHARHELRHARAGLLAARRAYRRALALNAAAKAAGASPAPSPSASTAAAALGASSSAAQATGDSATPTPTVAATPSPSPSSTAAPVSASRLHQLRAAIRHRRHLVIVLHHKVHELRRALRLHRAAAHAQWMPVVRDAARKNGISPTGLRRLMSLESGGRATADNGSFHGLYQYCWSTWRAAWNPYRGRSIYDGEAQIRATARAIRRGWGPSMWPNTYPIAF